jgi:hypothetical protein
VFDIVRGDYVDEPDDAKLVISSIKGMLSGLDPHSSYMDAQGFRDMEEETRGKFGGVGMEITKVGDAFKVVSAIRDAGSPRRRVRKDRHESIHRGRHPRALRHAILLVVALKRVTDVLLTLFPRSEACGQRTYPGERAVV